MGRSEESTTSSPAPKLIRHSVYYIDYITFAVGDTLFKVPRAGFEGRPGTPFEAFASLTKLNGSDEGYNDDHPVFLHGVEVNDFVNLLQEMYPNLYCASSSHRQPALPETSGTQSDPVSESDKLRWLSILKLSSMWAFDDLRKEAITILSKAHFEHKEWIHLAKTYNVPQWLVEGYRGIISQAGPLEKTGDLADLDWETFGKLLMIREHYPPNGRLSALLNMVTRDFRYKGRDIHVPVMASFRSIFSDCKAVEGDKVVSLNAVNMNEIVEKQFARELADLKY